MANNKKPRPGDVTEVAEGLVRALSLRSVCVSGVLQLLDLLQGNAHTVPQEVSTGTQHRQALLAALSAVSKRN